MKTATTTAFTTETQRHRGFKKFLRAVSVSLCLCGGLALLAACESTRATPDDEKPEEKPDQEIITGELQSDFLELGPAAGVQWLSFYPDDFLEYPELFEGLDADQRRRTRLAPREGANKVLLKFDLPAGAKIKPVDWYGTECVAIDLPEQKGFTVSLIDGSSSFAGSALAVERAKRLVKAGVISDWKVHAQATADGEDHSYWVSGPDQEIRAVYVLRRFSQNLNWPNLLIELFDNGKPLGERPQGLTKSLSYSIQVVRDLSLEGSPKHQCTSSVEDLKAGIVKYEKGGLRLALPEGWELRKSGGSSTVEIHGGGAKPLALIRRLAPKNGSLKTRVGADTVFSRRKARPDGFFGAGRALNEQEPFVVAFDYRDRSAEQVALCVIATGNELLTVEIIGTGVIEGEARRKLRDACLEMLKSAKPSATVANSVKDLNELVGWNPQ